MPKSKQIFTRVTPVVERGLTEIAKEMAEESGVQVGEKPFYKSDGSVNHSEIIRRLLGEADPRLATP